MIAQKFTAFFSGKMSIQSVLKNGRVNYACPQNFLRIGKILEQEWRARIVAIYRPQREILTKMIL
jgi:hypothetical protein